MAKVKRSRRAGPGPPGPVSPSEELRGRTRREGAVGGLPPAALVLAPGPQTAGRRVCRFGRPSVALSRPERPTGVPRRPVLATVSTPSALHITRLVTYLSPESHRGRRASVVLLALYLLLTAEFRGHLASKPASPGQDHSVARTRGGGAVAELGDVTARVLRVPYGASHVLGTLSLLIALPRSPLSSKINVYPSGYFQTGCKPVFRA